MGTELWVLPSITGVPLERSPLHLKSRLWIKVSCHACIRHYFPRRQGDNLERRLASPPHGNSTPGRISVGCLTKFRDRSIIIPDGIMAKQPAIDCFSDGWVPLCTLIGRLVWWLPTTGGLGASSGVACLFEAPSGRYSSNRI